LNRFAITVIIGVIVTAVAITVFVVSMNANLFEQSKTGQNTISNLTNTTLKLKIAASFFPLYEFARNVGGDKTEVYSFLPIGEEPHEWEPSIQEIEELKGTKLFIYNGAGMEGYVSKLISIWLRQEL
jgi:zinc transport system substrate-binding protein